jgi:hypothetical protein
MANHLVAEVEVSTELLPRPTSLLSFYRPTITIYFQWYSPIFIVVFHTSTFQVP